MNRNVRFSSILSLFTFRKYIIKYSELYKKTE